MVRSLQLQCDGSQGGGIEVGPLAANVQEFLSHRPPQTLEDTKVVAIADVANDGRIEDLG